LILAQPKPKLSESKEKPKRKTWRGGSRGQSGSITGSIFSAIGEGLGGSKRLGSSGRVADVDWQEGDDSKRGSKRIGISGKFLNGEAEARCSSEKFEAPARIADANLFCRSVSLRVGDYTRVMNVSLKWFQGETLLIWVLHTQSPVLFVQGTKDSMCPLVKLEQVRKKLLVENELYTIEGGDHGFKVGAAALKKNLLTHAEMEKKAMDTIQAFLTKVLPRWEEICPLDCITDL
jgi:hypothetical protein